MICLYHHFTALLPRSDEDAKHDQRTFETACGAEVTTREYEEVLRLGVPRRMLIVLDGAKPNNAPLSPDFGDCDRCYPNAV